jgi:hypothetical protein
MPWSVSDASKIPFSKWLFCIVFLGFSLPPPLPILAAEQEDSQENQNSPPLLDENHTLIKRTSEIEMYRCDECHSGPKNYNSAPRILTEEHDTIDKHPPKTDDPDRWCLACHMEKKYNKLRLSSGRKISFNESFLLCGECHGTQLRDWKRNFHGKTIGSWNGLRKVYSCTYCHNAHDPKFKPLKPEPPPDLPKSKKRED